MSIQTADSPKVNWIIVLISSGIIISIGMGVRQSFGIFLQPISDVLGEGRTLFSLAIALQNLAWGLAAPIFGAMADRYGPARVCMAGGLFYMTGLLLMAAVRLVLTIRLRNAGCVVSKPFLFSRSLGFFGTTSSSNTSTPILAKWQAIPAPITPDPNTATFFMRLFIGRLYVNFF